MEPTATTATAEDRMDEEAEDLAVHEAMAGYEGKRDLTRAASAPVIASAPAPEATPASTAAVDSLADQTGAAPDQGGAAANGGQAGAPATSPLDDTKAELLALRTKLNELVAQGVPQTEVRALQGQVGELNRTIQQLQSTSNAPSGPELDAALAKAEEMAQEFPDTFGPIVNVMKVLITSRGKQPAPDHAASLAQKFAAPTVINFPANTPAAAAPAEPTAEQVREEGRREALKEVMDGLHPDRHEINASPEFKAWFAAKPKTYQETMNSTWSPTVLSPMYEEFKATKTITKTKSDVLAAAVVPEATGGSPVNTTQTDEEAAWAGYKSTRAKRL